MGQGTPLPEDEAHAQGYPSLPGVGYWTMSLLTKTMRWSPEMFEIYQLPAADEMPMEFGSQRVPKEYWQQIEDAFYACIEAGVPYDLEIEIERSDGRRWVRLFGEPLRNDHGDIIGARGVVQDIERYKTPRRDRPEQQN